MSAVQPVNISAEAAAFFVLHLLETRISVSAEQPRNISEKSVTGAVLTPVKSSSVSDLQPENIPDASFQLHLSGRFTAVKLTQPLNMFFALYASDIESQSDISNSLSDVQFSNMDSTVYVLNVVRPKSGENTTPVSFVQSLNMPLMSFASTV